MEKKLDNKEDTRYFLNEDFFRSDEYSEMNRFKNYINRNGFFRFRIANDERIKVYLPALALFFNSNKVPVKNKICKTINGKEYFDAYLTGYKQGEKYFEKKFPTPLLYVEKIRPLIKKHWKQNENPLIITFKIIQKYGFDAGVINCFEDLTDKKYLDHIKAKKTGSKGLSYNEFGLLLHITSTQPTEDKCLEYCKKYGVEYKLDQIKRGYNNLAELTRATTTRKDGYKFRYFDKIINIFPVKSEFYNRTKKLKKELEENIDKAKQESKYPIRISHN